MSENYDQYPNQFVVALTGLLGCALDDHKHPEDGATYGENQEEEQANHTVELYAPAREAWKPRHSELHR